MVRFFPEEGETSTDRRIWRHPVTGDYSYTCADGASFFINGRGDHLSMGWPPDLTLEDAVTYLLGPIFGLTLRLRGKVCLHASAVAHAGHAVAFMAPPGFGKSTLAAVMARRGHPVLTDDITALEVRSGIGSVLPAYPRINLWPQAVESLFGDPGALARISPGDPEWDKRFLPLGDGEHLFQAEPLPLKVIYTASHRGDIDTLRITTLRGSQALTALLGNTYAWYALDRSMRAHEFDSFHDILPSLIVRSIESHQREVVSLAELGARIDDDLHELGLSS